MTTLNGLPRSWDSFIQGICARKKLVKFSRLWEEYSQEEARIATWEENMGIQDQALIVQSKKSRSSHHRSKYSHQLNNSRKPRDLSKYICYTCDERGHFARDYPKRKLAITRRRETREDIMLMLPRMMKLPQREIDKSVMKNMFWSPLSRELSNMEAMIGL